MLGLLLSACSFEDLAESTHPDRVKFSYYDEGTEETNTYLCKTDNRDAERQSKKAHEYFSNGVEQAAEQETEKFLHKSEDAEQLSIMDTMKFVMKMQAHGEKLGNEIEEKFQCLLIGTAESDE